MPVLAGTSEKPASSPDNQLGIEVLSVSVSKLARDSFGHAVNPFTGMNSYQGEGGTVVLAKITPRWSSPLKIQAEKCRLLSFKDDVGTDLFTNAAAGLGNAFFSENRPLEIFTAREPGCFGLRTRSARLPAHAANRLTAEVLLVFSRTSEEHAKQRTDVLLQTNEVVTVGPLKVKFTFQRPSSYPSSYYGTNQTAASSQSPYWLASFLPEKDVAIASVAFLSNSSDEPILVAKNVSAEGNASSSNTGIYNRRPDSAKPPDDFYNLVRHSFRPPENGKITMKVRYFDVESLVEKHCFISTGLSP
jgi:hypothetical protein